MRARATFMTSGFCDEDRKEESRGEVSWLTEAALIFMAVLAGCSSWGRRDEVESDAAIVLGVCFGTQFVDERSLLDLFLLP